MPRMKSNTQMWVKKGNFIYKVSEINSLTIGGPALSVSNSIIHKVSEIKQLSSWWSLFICIQSCALTFAGPPRFMLTSACPHVDIRIHTHIIKLGLTWTSNFLLFFSRMVQSDILWWSGVSVWSPVSAAQWRNTRVHVRLILWQQRKESGHCLWHRQPELRLWVSAQDVRLPTWHWHRCGLQGAMQRWDFVRAAGVSQ